MVMKVHKATGTYELQYVCNNIYTGANLTGRSAIHLSLLLGLRKCLDHKRGPAHVMGGGARRCISTTYHPGITAGQAHLGPVLEG